MAINLTKGQRIDLKKSSGATLTDFCVGVNWGGIESRGFLGLTKKVQNVDLDLSAVLLDIEGNLCDHIYSPLYKPEILAEFGLPPGKLITANGALKHTGDDRAGDSGGDDGLDNEIITVNLNLVPANVGQIVFFLNSCGKEDFAAIPYAKIRMFEGNPAKVKEVFAAFNVAAEPQYEGKRALILGRLYRKGIEWKFAAIGDPTEDVFVGQTSLRITQEYNQA
jgi:tellurium resistance protein TerZ